MELCFYMFFTLFFLFFCSDESISSVGSISDLEERLRPVHVKRRSQQSLNGIVLPTVPPSTTRTLVCEKDDNSPRYAHDHEVNSNANSNPSSLSNSKAGRQHKH